MRQGIETVPKDGKVVILEDDASGTYELAHWSIEEHAWVGENGKPSTITPTYWHVLQRDEYRLPERDQHLVQRECGSSAPTTSESRGRHVLPLCSGRAALKRAAEDDDIAPRQVATAGVRVPVVEAQTAPSESERGPPAWRRFVLSSIAAAMIAASLIGMYFRAQVGAYVMQYTGQQDIANIGTIGSDQTAASGPVQVKETEAPEAIEPLEKERRRADALEHGLAELRRAMEGRDLRAAATTAAQSEKTDGEKAADLMQDLAAARHELMANEVQYRGVLAEERDRSAALASELGTAQRNVEAQVALSSKMGNEAAQLKWAADTATSELQRERERAEALASELAKVRREVDALAALSGKKSDEAARPNQAAESATAKPSAAEAKQCSAALPSNPQGHWSYRLIDGRKCWYQGENNFPKSLLQWSEQDFSPHGFR